MSANSRLPHSATSTVPGTTVELGNAFTKNFPFPNIRDRQSYVLKEIEDAFASGYKHVLLEAPTGFGKSPVAIAAALTLGSSYICTSTKDLQTQYARDFPFIKVAKGKRIITFAQLNRILFKMVLTSVDRVGQITQMNVAIPVQNMDHV